MQTVVSSYPNGNFKILINFNPLTSQWHNENGPACIKFDINGNIICEEYYIEGIYHRDNGPAIILYENNIIKLKCFMFCGKKHNLYGPAQIKYDQFGNVLREEYFINDTRDIFNKPYQIFYYTNGNIKYENIRINCNCEIFKEYFENGNIKDVEYRENNKLNNDNGASIISYDNNGKIILKQYFINDEEINVHTDEEFEKYKKILIIK